MPDEFAELMIRLNGLLETIKDEGITKQEVLKEVDNVFDE